MLNYQHFCKLGALLSCRNIQFDVERFSKILDIIETCMTKEGDSEYQKHAIYFEEENKHFRSLLV